MPLLEVRDLSVSFRNDKEVFKAVSGISFDVQEGEILGIVGESGSGKSVTSLSIMQLLSEGQIEGNIVYSSNGRKITLTKTTEKQLNTVRGKEISMIFQEPMTSLNPVFTCGNQVAEALIRHEKLARHDAKVKTIELFNEVMLPRAASLYNSYPHELSGGQKQRVMIAMAIACNPKILIADEPTTALDVTVQKTILKLLLNLKDRYKLSVIFITHDLGVIAEIADRVLVMYKGKIVEHGSVTQIFNNPHHPYTKGLLACRPPLRKELIRLPVMDDFIRTSAAGEILSNDISVPDILNKLELKDTKLQRLLELNKEQLLLKVENLEVKYPIKKGILRRTGSFVNAVNKITLNIRKGEVLGLVGESGCGKTTLGRAILNLITPGSGVIQFKGRNILSLDAYEMRSLRKEMQIIFQDPYSSLNPRMTIGNAIQEPMKVHNIYKDEKERKFKTEELLEKVGLPSRVFSRYPHEFSGGQRQRICIARALAVKPEFIICDESVSALDVSVQAQVLNLLNDLKNEFNLTYIFISHDLAVVRFMSDRIIVMQSGEIVEEGAADQIYFNPKMDYTKKLISSIPGNHLFNSL
jgi:peptide/nickel transport system ATP-binding protein